MLRRLVVGVLCAGLILLGSSGARAQEAVPASQEAQTGAEPAAPAPFSPEEEQSFSDRDQQPGREVAGGALTNQQLTYIVIALATAVIVLILT